MERKQQYYEEDNCNDMICTSASRVTFQGSSIHIREIWSPKYSLRNHGSHRSVRKILFTVFVLLVVAYDAIIIIHRASDGYFSHGCYLVEGLLWISPSTNRHVLQQHHIHSLTCRKSFQISKDESPSKEYYKGRAPERPSMFMSYQENQYNTQSIKDFDNEDDDKIISFSSRGLKQVVDDSQNESKIGLKTIKNCNNQSPTQNYSRTPCHRRTMILSTIGGITSFISLESVSSMTIDKEVTFNSQWIPSERAELSSSSSSTTATNNISICPPIFCTYLTRFLLNYDHIGLGLWWNEQEYKYQLLSTRDIQLYQLFGMISKSIERDIYTFIRDCIKYEVEHNSDTTTTTTNDCYVKLWDLFMTKYGKESDANRQIAILFTLLPPDQQPLSRLAMYHDNIKKEQQQNQKQWEAAEQKLDITDINFATNFTKLLPIQYEVTRGRSISKLVDNELSSSPTMANKGNPMLKRSQKDPNDLFFQLVPSLPLQPNKIRSGGLIEDTPIPPNGNNAIISTMFGPVGIQPLRREIFQFSNTVYSRLGLAGAMGCAITHSIVIPLDVIKTRAQTDPTMTTKADTSKNDRVSNSISLVDSRHEASSIDNADYVQSGIQNASSSTKIGLFGAYNKIIQNEGISGLFLGAQATLVGYFWYGLSVYPTYTFVKRSLIHGTSSGSIIPLDYAAVHTGEIAIVAGAVAAVVASLGLTPIEAARIRVVAEPLRYRSLGLLGTLTYITKENPTLGWMALYTGLPSLLTRQVIFGSVKFLAFERACDSIYSLWPILQSATWMGLIVSLVAGGFSGTISSVVSQPADSVLTYVASRSTSSANATATINGSKNQQPTTNVIDSMKEMILEGGFGSLYRGVGSRSLWAGSIIAGQFFLYDIIRTIFHVNTGDLSEMFVLQFPSIDTIESIT